MKKSILSAFMLMAFCATQAQTYLYYDDACMHRLEYKYQNVSSNSSVISYSVPSVNGDMLLLDIGLESNKFLSGAPSGTLRCDQLGNKKSIAAGINKGTSILYIVRKVEGKGYTVTPASTATYVHKSGERYQFEGYNYAFAADASVSSFDENLATGMLNGHIYMTNRDMKGCLRSFSFKREPDEVCAVSTQFEFISDIGMYKESHGITQTDLAPTGMILVSVDGMPLDQYVQQACTGVMFSSTQSKTIQIETPVVYSAPTKAQTIAKSAKTTGSKAPVTYSVTNTAAKSAKTVGRPVVDGSVIPGTKYVPSVPAPKKVLPSPCPNKSGNGWHVVEKGQSLYAISRQYDVPVKSLVAWNKLADPNDLKPCQKIAVVYVKPKSATVKPVEHSAPVTYSTTTTTKTVSPVTMRSANVLHIVQPKETLYSLAQVYGYSTDRFAAMNGLTRDAVLVPGHQLVTTDCTCPIERAESAASLGITTTSMSPKSPEATVVVEQPAQYYYKQPVDHSISSVTYTTIVDEVPSTYSETSAIFPLSGAYSAEKPVETSTQLSIPPPVDRNSTVTYYTGQPIKTYTVIEGDSIEQIARRFKVTMSQLRAWNNLAENEVLLNGQTLIVQR